MSQLLREVVEPLPSDWRQDVAIAELEGIIRERGRDVGVNMDEVQFAAMKVWRPTLDERCAAVQPLFHISGPLNTRSTTSVPKFRRLPDLPSWKK